MTHINKLTEEAIKVRDNAYAPYSKFKVGAALLTKSGKVYTGCNIGNAAYPVSICAERVAVFKAISEREYDFSEIVVVADTEQPISPCGSCRQVMSEFFDENVNIHLTNLKGDTMTCTIKELLPFSFKQGDLLGE